MAGAAIPHITLPVQQKPQKRLTIAVIMSSCNGYTMSDKGWHILSQLNLRGCCSKAVINGLQGFVLAWWKQMSRMSQKDARWMAWSRAPQAATSTLQSKALLLICGVRASWQGAAPGLALLELFPAWQKSWNAKGRGWQGCWLCPAAQACGGSLATTPAPPQQVPAPHFQQQCHEQAFLLHPRSSSPSPACRAHELWDDETAPCGHPKQQQLLLQQGKAQSSVP